MSEKFKNKDNIDVPSPDDVRKSLAKRFGISPKKLEEIVDKKGPYKPARGERNESANKKIQPEPSKPIIPFTDAGRRELVRRAGTTPENHDEIVNYKGGYRKPRGQRGT